MENLVEKGQGIAVIAGGRWRFEQNPNVRTLDLVDGNNDFDIALITKKGAYLPYAAKYFLDFCKKRAKL
jgi:DNA-binding transcriptional LysR family regulator